jgi:hypothetical protein
MPGMIAGMFHFESFVLNSEIFPDITFYRLLEVDIVFKQTSKHFLVEFFDLSTCAKGKHSMTDASMFSFCSSRPVAFPSVNPLFNAADGG